jgi:hypothetical protein
MYRAALAVAPVLPELQVKETQVDQIPAAMVAAVARAQSVAVQWEIRAAMAAPDYNIPNLPYYQAQRPMDTQPGM